MQIHNILEEIVIERVNILYEQVKKMGAQWVQCDCSQCRLDTTGYVLNRLPPRYVVSGRGVNHNISTTDAQLNADIDALILEGMRIVSSVQRPYHDKETLIPEEYSGSYYNFPTFFGYIYDGVTFEPLIDAKITLKLNGEKVDMVDNTWSNPAVTSKSTKAAYSFWVKPMEAKEDSAVYDFQVEVEAEGYEKLSYSFEVPVAKESTARKTLNSTYSLKIQDLFLFPVKE